MDAIFVMKTMSLMMTKNVGIRSKESPGYLQKKKRDHPQPQEEAFQLGLLAELLVAALQ